MTGSSGRVVRYRGGATRVIVISLCMAAVVGGSACSSSSSPGSEVVGSADASEGSADPSFAPVPPVLAEVPGAAAVQYFTALFTGDFDIASGRVAAACRDSWDGDAEIGELVTRGLFEADRSGEAPRFDDFSGFSEEIDGDRRRLVFERNGSEVETTWVLEDEVWRISTCT